ncbi:gtpase activating protein [Lasallia pustulata]|uniref:Gtpase activating protein n=1 Tax=Lasallia pustulata TaxID=136370 RepID=A0A1W5CRX1_9LECA|nr:gtpase activating protein [Lasallia pustulata]
MDAGHVVDVETAKDASTHEANKGPGDMGHSSLSTFSMDTVRLSASEPFLSEDSGNRPTTTTVPYLTNLNEYAVEEPLDERAEHDNGFETAAVAEDVSFQGHEHRASVASGSMPSMGDEGESVSTVRSRSNSSTTASSSNSTHVDWDELERSEEQEPRDEGSDESTAFLLARLEQENNALATDPKAGLSRPLRNKRHSRPPSIQYLKKLVNEPTRPSLRYSLLPSPAMTELEFWAVLVTDYPQTAQHLPTLTSNKIRGGIPPPLRGVVWMSIAGARDRFLEAEYERLSGESSPYENLIGKDIGRSFPGVEMFRDPNGDGQKMLGKVLKCFSLYDQKIGYCQGLGFVVGPLLMHLRDSEAFCVLVRLMEHYDLRSCFLPDLSGLHLRIYQFQHLLAQHLPLLTHYLEKMQIEPLYVSQWFLSFFAVTCPLPMLLRIYDVILTEGASETLMRVALSLMRRNQQKILGCTEFDDIMRLLLSRGLWDTYGSNADDLVNDFIGLTGLVTRENLQALERSFREAQNEGNNAKMGSTQSVQSAASRFLGHFWAGSVSSTKSMSLSPGLPASSRPVSFLRRSPSKQSMASTLSSVESAESASTAPTDTLAMSRQGSADCNPLKTTSPTHSMVRNVMSNRDKDLHTQIEELLTALGDMQREQILLAGELQKEREEREEDHQMIRRLVERLRKPKVLISIPEECHESPKVLKGEDEPLGWEDVLVEVEDRILIVDTRRSSILQTKHQLRDDVIRWKEQYDLEATRSLELSRQVTDHQQENSKLREELRDARSRLQSGDREKQRLEKVIQELKARRPSTSLDSTYATSSSPTSEISEFRLSVAGGLRELKLGRPGSTRSPTMPAYSKRASSLSTQAILATEDHKPPAEDAILLELVNAKTAEAVARQELEEVKGKLDSLRKMVGGTSTWPGTSGHRPSPSEPFATSWSPSRPAESPKPFVNTSGGGGFFSGWGKRTVSSSATPTVSASEYR